MEWSSLFNVIIAVAVTRVWMWGVGYRKVDK